MKKVLLLLCCWLAVLGASAAYPDKLYLIGNVNDWSTSNPVRCDEASNGVYTWNSVNLKNADNDSYSYFTFVTKTGTNWDVVNGGDRYGANSDNVEITAEATITKYPVNVSASSAKNWKAKGGTYKVVADLTKNKLTISEPDKDRITIYWDNTTANWGTPHIHYWGISESVWPGVAMTYVSGSTWKYDCPAGTTGCLFNAGDGDASKTDNFTAAANHIYTQSGDQGEYDPNGGGGDDPDPVIPDDPDPVTPSAQYYVYFDNSGSNWATPKVWIWNDEKNQLTESGWAGDEMEKKDGNIWYYELKNTSNGAPKYIIFSNNGSSQTATLAYVNGATYKSDGSFTKPATAYEPTGTLPVLYINVYADADHTALENEIIDKDLAHKNYFSNAEYWLEANGMEGAESLGSKDAPLPLEIKARGNYTRKGYSKKPFKLKLGKKQNLLGMTPDKSKHYALITHADDPFGYMRNFVGFRLGQMIGLPWTPNQQPVEVVINGDYRGIYFLTESIRVGDGRVPITELADEATNPADISGGYLVELDNYEDDAVVVLDDPTDKNGSKLMVTPDTPEVYSDQQLRFIKEQFTTMNNLVASTDKADEAKLWSYLDQDDAARYYVVEEILSHYEAYHGSTYLYRDKGEGQKWHFSPLWDCGHAFDGSAQGFFSEEYHYGNNWIGSSNTNKGLRFKDSFMDKVKKTFQWFVNKETDGSTSPYERLLVEIDDYVARIKDAAMLDAQRWAGEPLPEQVGLDVPAAVVNNSDIESHDKAAVKDFLNTKIEWLKGQWGSDKLAEPDRDDTPAAELPAYVQENYVAPTYDIYVVDDAETPWGNVHMWLYVKGGANYSEKWPGPEMEFDKTLIVNGHTGAYHFTVPEDFFKGLVIFSHTDANGNSLGQYPSGDMVDGLAVADKYVFHTNDNKWGAATSIEYVKPYSGTLPVVYISTVEQGGTSEATRPIGYGDAGQLKKCSFSIDALGLEGYSDVAAGTAGKLSIKGRGKDWKEGDKNSYKLKLGNKCALLGMNQSAHWLLMSYRSDAANGLLTNYAGHELARTLCLGWTPSMEPVELMIDGEYQGLYFLVENVRAAADRVPIADYGDTAAKNGKDYSEEHDFLLEFDADHDDATEVELFYSWADEGNSYTHKFVTATPALEDIKTAEETERIRTYLDSHISRLRSAIEKAAADIYDRSWTDLIDYEQAAKYYIVQEIMDDPTAFKHNFYMYHTSADGQENGSKWVFGPVWDFSNALTEDGGKTHLMHEAADFEGSFIKGLYKNQIFAWLVNCTYYKFVNGNRMPNGYGYTQKAPMRKAAEGDLLLTYDPEVNGAITNVITSIDDMAEKIQYAAVSDAERWPEYAATSDEEDDSILNRASNLGIKLYDNMENYLSQDTDLGGAGWGLRDILTGIEDIALGADGEAAAEYFDLTGRRILRPQAGSFYIVRRGAEVSKQLVR